jgi:thiol-disulfide isomerase/thioredoxin
MIKQILKFFILGVLAAFIIVFARFSMNQLIVNLSCGIVFFWGGVWLTKKRGSLNSKIPIILFLSFPIYALLYSSFTNFPFWGFWLTQATLTLFSFFVGFKMASKSLTKIIIAFICIISISILSHIYLTPFARYTAYKIISKKGDKIVSKKVTYSFITNEGETLSQSNYINSVVLIDYWFIGCKPCYEKMQALAELSDIYKKNDNVKIIAIDAATTDSYSEFLEECKSLPKGLIYGYDTSIETKLKFKIEGYPTEILITKDGNVEQYLSGFNLDYKDKYIRETKNKIDELLRKK